MSQDLLPIMQSYGTKSDSAVENELSLLTFLAINIFSC